MNEYVKLALMLAFIILVVFRILSEPIISRLGADKNKGKKSYEVVKSRKFIISNRVFTGIVFLAFLIVVYLSMIYPNLSSYEGGFKGIIKDIGSEFWQLVR